MSHICFFFQAEYGIRVIGVTGVQTCALPIYAAAAAADAGLATVQTQELDGEALDVEPAGFSAVISRLGLMYFPDLARALRSEERRVGKECRSRWSPYH